MPEEWNSWKRMKAVLNLQLPDCIPVAPHLGCGYTPIAAGHPVGDFYVADNEGIADIYLKAYLLLCVKPIAEQILSRQLCFFRG